MLRARISIPTMKNPYQELFQRPLIPEKLSNEGPAVVNEDLMVTWSFKGLISRCARKPKT